MASDHEITTLAKRWSTGDPAARDRLIELTYPKLRQIARRHLGSNGHDPTLDTTALVHEAYLHFGSDQEGPWPSRAHFFAFCSQVMRRVLIDYARRRQAEKRGGSRVRVPLRDDLSAVDAQIADVLEIEEALEFLAAKNERMARIVECRFFGGLSIEETAEALGSSARTVSREWTRARAYLLHALDVPGPTARQGPASGA